MNRMISQITLENLEGFSVPIETHPLKWMFEDDNGFLPEEHKDQIIPLNPNAAKFLWDFEGTQRQLGNIAKMEQYYKKTKELKSGRLTAQEVKKWLFNLGIPFGQKVFWSHQPEWGFVLTWKIIVKYSDEIFVGNDVVIWDRSLNWCLIHHHDDAFHFGSDRVENATVRGEEIFQNKKRMNDLIKKNES